MRYITPKSFLKYGGRLFTTNTRTDPKKEKEQTTSQLDSLKPMDVEEEVQESKKRGAEFSLEPPGKKKSGEKRNNICFVL